MRAPGKPEETAARATASDQDGDIKRVSTKDWARSTGYDPVKIFNKVGSCCRCDLWRYGAKKIILQ